MKEYEVSVHATLKVAAVSPDDASRQADDVLAALDGIDKRAGRPRLVPHRPDAE